MGQVTVRVRTENIQQGEAQSEACDGTPRSLHSEEVPKLRFRGSGVAIGWRPRTVLVELFALGPTYVRKVCPGRLKSLRRSACRIAKGTGNPEDVHHYRV